MFISGKVLLSTTHSFENVTGLPGVQKSKEGLERMKVSAPYYFVISVSVLGTLPRFW